MTEFSQTKDPRLLEVTPKKLRDIKIFIITYNGNVVDVTKTVTEVSIYESIYTPFMYGEIMMIDNSAMLSTFPFVGQEKVRIIWQREDKTVENEFYITDVFDVGQINDFVGGYGLSFTSEKQVRNAISLFSKSYKGNSAEIISKIHKEYLKQDIELLSNGAFSHNIVFPYTKPFAAINMIQRATPAEDNTPMFIFETLYGNKTYLNSMGNMLRQDPVMIIEPKVVVNLDSETGTISTNLARYRNHVYGYNISKGYDTLDKLSSGAFGSQTVSVDISQQKATITDFDFTLHAPSIRKEWITTFFTFDDVPNTESIEGSSGVRVNGIRSTKLSISPKNSLAYEDFPNLNGVDENIVAGMKSYMKRLNTISINVHMNSVPDLEVGKTVDLKLQRFSPNLADEDSGDKVNSGVYLISSIRHYIKNTDYTMSLELIRDGIGDEADYYVNRDVPNFGAPVRIRKSLLPEIGDFLNE